MSNDAAGGSSQKLGFAAMTMTIEVEQRGVEAEDGEEPPHATPDLLRLGTELLRRLVDPSQLGADEAHADA